MKKRHKRAVFIFACLAAIGLATWLVLGAFRIISSSFSADPDRDEGSTGRENLSHRRLVQDGTLKRDMDGLTVRFTVTDTANTIPSFTKDPSRPFQGRARCVAQGRVEQTECSTPINHAKHDENYMPPEAARALDQAKDMNKVKNWRMKRRRPSRNR